MRRALKRTNATPVAHGKSDLGVGLAQSDAIFEGTAATRKPSGGRDLHALFLARFDREDMEREAAFSRLLEKAGVAPESGERVVDLPRGLALEDFADDPLVSVVIRESRRRGAFADHETI